MKRYIRFDSVGGASGDMILAALASVGADLAMIEKSINRFFPQKIRLQHGNAAEFALNGIRLKVQLAEKDQREPDDSYWPDAMSAQHAHAHEHEHTHGGHAHQHNDHQHAPHTHAHQAHHEHAHRKLSDITDLINNSELSTWCKELASAVFTKLAETEARIHGKSVDSVHFHEVGAWDSVADIVGCCLALEQLRIDGISCSPLPCGCGTIHCAHGEMPNPAPATQLLLQGLPVEQTSEAFELVTPTGAALLATWLEQLETPPATTIPVRTGFGFGSRQLAHRPNTLRATILEQSYYHKEQTASEDELTVLETNLDDCNAEWLGDLSSELLKQGALDVWHTPIIMKKGRPAVKLSVLLNPQQRIAIQKLIFRSTTTFGIRYYNVKRCELQRDFISAKTPWGAIPVKRGFLDGKAVTLSPEYEVCAELAAKHALTPKEIYEVAKSISLNVESS